MSADAPRRDLTAISPADLATLLRAAARAEITEAMIRADIDAGAPVNRDGTLHLLHYLAWLLREERRDRGPHGTQAD